MGDLEERMGDLEERMGELVAELQSGMGDLEERIAAAKDAANEAEAAANLAWLDGVGLGSKGVKKANKGEAFDRALAHYKEGMTRLKELTGSGEADSECAALLSSLHSGCAQVLIDKGLPYTSMKEAAQAIDLDPSNMLGHLLRARAVLNMERAQEMYYGDETEHDEYLFQCRMSLEKVLSKEPTNAQAKEELEYCLHVIEMGPSMEDPDGTPCDPGFSRSGSRSGSLSRRPLSRSGSLTGGRMRSGSLSGCRDRPMSATMQRSPSLGSLDKSAPSPGRIRATATDTRGSGGPCFPQGNQLGYGCTTCTPSAPQQCYTCAPPINKRPMTPTRGAPPSPNGNQFNAPGLARSRSDVGMGLGSSRSDIGMGLGSFDARKMVNEGFSRRSSRAEFGSGTAGAMKASSRSDLLATAPAVNGRSSRGELSASRGSGRR